MTRSYESEVGSHQCMFDGVMVYGSVRSVRSLVESLPVHSVNLSALLALCLYHISYIIAAYYCIRHSVAFYAITFAF